jgi:hypothetical protein
MSLSGALVWDEARHVTEDDVGSTRTHASQAIEAGVQRLLRGRSLEELVEVLRSHGVELLVDVRLNAISHRPGFSKRALSAALGAADID